MRRIARLLLCLLLLPLAALPAQANDSEAEIGIGGIVLRPSEAIVMASEDLYISEEIVRIAYRFVNPTDRDVTATIAFPMPAQPRGIADTWFFVEEKQDWSDFGFSTKVDGKPVRLSMIERAMIGERDVTDRVAALGLPLYWFLDEDLDRRLEGMSETARASLHREGLLAADPASDGRVVPAWDAVTFFTREQTFPAGATVSIEHEYAPLNGGSVGGALDRSVRESDPKLTAAYRERYCIDDHFLAGLDRRIAERQKPGIFAGYSETWIGYVLSSGANWKGPIGDFRLVIDKGSPENLVSFCMDSVRKIAPTRFEVRRSDFEPERDLDILLIKFFEIED